mmetsp:Transcript_43213/g.109129  ORF Transcript_43213/g.109129 Transcript_43213/m.109129 type:complete len:104 (-) Transcript_43213:72-383(-)|eukprot:CAMPEP_0177653616 /NCGR_PEP_ID=MMETSP0447-20121125/13841_1 /TAXON_ID=0 /ORGANISM="Stygamoeba regulata, Strain BSH-02190019" /LENGTH=103 /DNA_ID=CAMNT_0019157105 /DNA_START=150 /DNA_END=461 /DNA_ORIENTATION=+
MAALRPLLNGIRHAALWPLAGKQTVDQGAEIMSFGFYHYVGNLATKWSLAPAEARQLWNVVKSGEYTLQDAKPALSVGIQCFFLYSLGEHIGRGNPMPWGEQH